MVTSHKYLSYITMYKIHIKRFNMDVYCK